MSKDELLNQTIEMIKSYIEGEPNLQYYPTIYASRMELLNELKNSMLIPKPKFNIGDHINTIVENEHFIIDDCKYSVLDKEWYYMCCDYYTDYHYTENEIYLIKSKESK